MSYKNKNIAILGLGKSGEAVARKLLALGARVTISEKRLREKCDFSLIEELSSLGVIFEFGEHSLATVSNKQFIVVSPGIHLNIPQIKEARKHGTMVISEIEFAFRFLHKPIIAVTGTNGKTTTATLIHEMLIAGGKKAALAGNIGTPLITIDDHFIDFIVVEVSSYQLEAISSFRPWISLMLNITPDHMERHKSMEEYAKTKARIFVNQGKTDYLIYNDKDEIVKKIVESSKARKIAFNNKGIFFDPKEINLKGEHNIENIMAASLAAELCGVPRTSIRETLFNFKGVPHRIEHIKTIDRVDYYNDSKATNPDSTVKALEAISNDDQTKNIILILGGVDKGVSLSGLINSIKKTTKTIILIGEAAIRFNNELIQSGFSNIKFAESMDEAVRIAKDISIEGDQVLLSPACASFDMFLNFEDRGRVFRKVVEAL